MITSTGEYDNDEDGSSDVDMIMKGNWTGTLSPHMLPFCYHLKFDNNFGKFGYIDAN